MIPLGKRPQDRYAVLISRHGDGGINAAACESFGIRPDPRLGRQAVQECTSAAAFRACARWCGRLDQGDSVTLTADIPKKPRIAGPRHRHAGAAFRPADLSLRGRDQPQADRAKLGPDHHRPALWRGRAGHRRAGARSARRGRGAMEAARMAAAARPRRGSRAGLCAPREAATPEPNCGMPKRRRALHRDRCDTASLLGPISVATACSGP